MLSTSVGVPTEPARLSTIVFAFVKYENEYSLAKQLKKEHEYCNNPIRKGKGVMELANQYDFDRERGERFRVRKVIQDFIKS